MLNYYRLFITVLTLLCTNTFAKNVDPLTYCLGQEELMFHKAKDTGPYYKLNQAFINDISSFGGALLKPKLLKTVCKAKKKASYEFLKILVLNGKNAFASYEKLNIYQQANLQSLIDSVPNSFSNFIGQLGSLFPHASCLPKYAPDIAYYRERLKYLETDLSQKELLSNKKRLRRIFAQLENVETLIQKCKKEFPNGTKS